MAHSGIWLAAILFAHFRGRVKLPLSRQLLDHSVLLAPVNAFMVLASRVPTTPLPAVARDRRAEGAR